MARIRIALAQINVTVGDLEGNRAKIVSWMHKARDSGAHLATFPELSVSGYPPEDLLLKQHFLADCQDSLNEIAAQCKDMAALVGFPEYFEGKTYNAAALMADGNILGVYRKIELPNYGVFDEKRYFHPGNHPLIFQLAGVRCGVTICEDIWVEANPSESCMREAGVAAVVNISASPFYAGKHHVRLEVLRRFASRVGATVLYNNLVGGQDELIFDGGSMVVGRHGALVCMAERFTEDLLLYDIEVADVELGRAAQSPQDSAPIVHVPEPKRSPEMSSVTLRAPRELSETEEVYAALVLGTRDYVRKNGFEKTVLGLSGGIDSALTAVVAVEALGRDNVVAVTMPSQYTSSGTLSDANLLAANLGVRLLTVPIAGIFHAYMAELSPFLGEGPPGLEAENLQARIRGNLLMTFSNRFGWLVLTTGNKSETAVGYSTLYGDTAGGFAVIKDVPKVMVYQLAEYVNTKSGRPVIPRSIIERPPTAELRPDQKDEDSLPPYHLLDTILRAYVEEDRAPEEIVRAGFPPELVIEVVRMVDRNEYKRRQAPPGVKITPKAFGRDRRLPITNRYRPRPR
ncbi:MAG: NAD+ synthase [Desulfomonilaceae bacterium]